MVSMPNVPTNQFAVSYRKHADVCNAYMLDMSVSAHPPGVLFSSIPCLVHTCVCVVFPGPLNHLHIIYRQREFLHFFTSKSEHTSCDIIMIINGRLSPEYHKYKQKHNHSRRLSVQIVQHFSTCSKWKRCSFSPLFVASIDISRSMNYCRHIH